MRRDWWKIGARMHISAIRAMLLLVSFTALMPSCRKREAPLTEEEAKAVVDLFDKGWRSKNARLVDSVLSANYLYFTQSGRTFDRASLVATAGSEVYELQTMDRDSYTVQLEGNTAVVNTVWMGKGYYHGEAFDDRQRCSITVVKHNGRVTILAEHCTPIRGGSK